MSRTELERRPSTCWRTSPSTAPHAWTILERRARGAMEGHETLDLDGWRRALEMAGVELQGTPSHLTWPIGQLFQGANEQSRAMQAALVTILDSFVSVGWQEARAMAYHLHEVLR